MAVRTTNPGPQQPQKYKVTPGPRYQRYGEQAGFRYDPYSDHYYPEPGNGQVYNPDTGNVEDKPKTPGLAEQLIPVAGTAAAIGVGTSLGKDGGSGLLSGLQKTVGSIKDTLGFGGPTQATTSSVGSNAAQTVATPEVISASRVPGSVADSGVASAAPSGLSQGLGAAGAAYGTYQALKGVESGNPVQAGLGGAGAWAGLNALGVGLGPAGWATIAAPAILSMLHGKHETTKEAQKKRWAGLADRDIAGAEEGYQAMHQVEDPGINKTGPTAGQKWNFNTALEEVKTSTPGQFRGVYGNFDTFGNDWINYTPEIQDKIIQGVANAGLYTSKKGDVLIKDKAAAQKIKDQVLASPASSGLMAGVRPAGFDEDPNHPGQFIRRA